jgi:hypothetical protein
VNKKIILFISIIINIFLAIVLVAALGAAYDKLKFTYVTEEKITADSLRNSIERQSYGNLASLSRLLRGGAKISKEDYEFYKLGEYADLQFMKAVYAKKGDTATYQAFDEKMSEIRKDMPEYESIFEKIDYSLEGDAINSTESTVKEEKLED